MAVVALFSLLLVGCGSSSTASESSSALNSSQLVVPQVEKTYENLQACYEHFQPKDFVESGSGMDATIAFYTQLSSASTGNVSRGFALVASRATELSPHYEADDFPPQEMMANFQGAIYALDLLCNKVLEGGVTSSQSTVIPTNESVPSDTSEVPTNVEGNYANQACNFIAQKIYFDPWGWDVYDIKSDAETDFGKKIGGSSIGIDVFLRNSFSKYIKIFNTASSMTSDGMVSGVFQSIASALQDYVYTHDTIPYPDFERDFDQKIDELVKLSWSKCNLGTKTDDAATNLQEKIVNGLTIKPGANLSGANLSGANLNNTNLSGANLSRANLFRATLFRADLSSANLSEANLGEASLSSANLFRADLSRADLYYARLPKANLSEANLGDAMLSSADLSGANLSGANLSGANLNSADLSGANLSGANLSGANLNNVNFSGANLTGAIFPNGTIHD